MIEILVFLGILLLGSITSYEDIKQNIVRNKWVMLAVLYAVVVYTTGFLLSMVSVEYIRQHSINLFYASVVSILIWLGDMWPPGDAKLYIAFSALFPISALNVITYGAFFDVLVNIFLPIFAYLLYRITVKSTWKQKIESFWIDYSSILGLFAVLWLSFGLMNLFGIEISFVFSLLVILAVSSFLKKFGKYLIAISLIIVLFDFSNIFTWPFILGFLKIVMLFIVIRNYIIVLGSHVFVRYVDIEKLKPGMRLAKSIHKFNPVTLRSRDIKKLTKLHSSGTIKEHRVQVLETIPFAPFIFSGILITYLLKSNVIVFFSRILGL